MATTGELGSGTATGTAFIGAIGANLLDAVPDVFSFGSGLVPPAGFTFPFSTYPVSISQSGKTFNMSVGARDFIDPACLTGLAYHVDPVNGNDANTGLGNFDGDFRAAISVKTIGKAITLGNASAAAYRVILKGGTTYALADQLFGGAAVFPTRSIAMYGSGANKAILSTHSDPTWAVDGTYTNTYSGTVPNTVLATTPVGRVFDLANRDLYGDATDLTLAADATTCNTTPGTYFADMTVTPNKIYVRRVASDAVTAANTRVNVRIQTTGTSNFGGQGKSYHIENLEFWGGTTAGAFPFNPNYANCVISGYNVAARYADKANGNGFAIAGAKLSILENWICSANQSDGYNIHDSNNLGTVAISINGLGYNNGYSGTTSCNGITAHDGVRLIDINGRYYDNYGGNSAHVSTAAGGTGRTQVWSLGCAMGASRGNYPGSVTLQNAAWSGGADCWWDTCVFSSRTAGILTDVGGGMLGATYVHSCTVLGGHTETGGATYGTY